MNIVEGTGFQREFQDATPLANYSRGNGERISRILGRVERLSLADGDSLTIYDFDTIVVEGGTLHAFGSGTVYALGTSTVHAHDEVRVIAFGTSTTYGYGRASITCSDKATCIGFERSRLTLRDFSNGTLRDFAIGSFHNFSNGTIHDQGSGTAYDMAVIDIHGDHASLRARGMSRTTITGTPSVWLSGGAVAHTAPETRTQFIVVTESARVVTTAMTRPSDVELVPSAHPTTGYQDGGSPAEDLAVDVQTTQQTSESVPATAPEPAAPESTPEPTVSESTPDPTPMPIPAPEPGSTPEPTQDPAVHRETTRAGAAPSGIPLAEFGPEWRPLLPALT